MAEEPSIKKSDSENCERKTRKETGMVKTT